MIGIGDAPIFAPVVEARVQNVDEESNPDLSMQGFEPELEPSAPMLLGSRVHENRHSHATRVKAYQGMEAPFCLASMLANEDPSVALRIFLLDNSGSTSAADGHVLHSDGLGRLQSVSATRWEEICATALDQARWNATAGVRSEFILLNPPCPEKPQEGRDFAVVDPKAGRADVQVEVLRRLLAQNGPRGTTPLTMRLQQLQQRLANEVKDGRRVLLCIVTDGLPTSLQDIRSSEHDKSAFVNQLRSFTSSFNAFVVIRLATDDEDTVDYYNRIDEELELPLDILDDLKGEAEEVHACGNGWFAYTPLVHRIREGGTLEKLFDLLDERALTTPEIAKFMELLFRGPDEAPFSRNAQELLNKAKMINATSMPVYDARLDRTMPPVNIKLLEKALGQSSLQRLRATPARLMRSLICGKNLPRE